MSDMILNPVMTSDNTPSGQCSASSNFPNGYEPYKAFTQAIDTTSMWHATGPAPQWIQYKFDTPKCVNKIAVRNTTNAEPRSIKKFILQASNDGSTWTNLGECNVQNNSDLQYFNINNSNKYEYYRLNITEGYDNAYIGLNRIDLIYKDEAHIKSAGSPEAIRDWLNASLYNKEEIDELFIQNNQAGLIPYDLTVEGYEPEQMVKLVGQTSGKVYNLCLAALMGEDMKETVLWTNSGSTNPQTITLADDWTKYKLLAIGMINRPSGRTDIITACIPVSIIKQLYDGGETCSIAAIDNSNYISYATTNDTKQLSYRASSGPYILHSVVGYS